MSKKLIIGMFGFGVVGQGLYDIIKTKKYILFFKIKSSIYFFDQILNSNFYPKLFHYSVVTFTFKKTNTVNISLT